MTRNRATDRDRESFKALQRKHATGTQDAHLGRGYVSTRMNLEPSYPEVMRVNRQIYQESIHLIWTSSEKQVEVKLEKDGLYIFSTWYKASMEDQNLPHLGSDLRNVKSILLVIRDQDYKNWPSRVLMNVLGLALLGNKSLVKLSIVFWFLIRRKARSLISKRAERAVTRFLRPFYNLMFVQVQFHIEISRADSGYNCERRGLISDRTARRS